MPDAGVADLAESIAAGERRALARGISLVEDEGPGFEELLDALHGRLGAARRIGITGPPGAGKSTLTAALVRHHVEEGLTVGVIAVDPTSPFTGGALLGDRIRMQELTRDPEVFVRSMATRGELGGLAAASADVAAVLDAAGKDAVLLETVGAGQDEIEVASLAETTVVVLTPASGDDVQAMKAGVMEVADILVVNKADLPGAEILAAQLQALVSMAARGRLEVPVLRTVAPKGEGVAELADAIEEHHRRLEASGERDRQRLERARRQVLAQARHQLLARALRAAERDGRLEGLIRAVAARELDPHAAAQQLIDGGA